jgi:O-antigen/teichoic acid export membrane protein
MEIHGYIKFGLNKHMLKRSLKYSIPILPHNLATNLNTYSTKTIINSFLGYTVSGLCTLASQFSTIFALVQSSVNLAFRPWFVEQMESGEDGRKQIKYMSCMIMSLFSFCAVVISLFSKEIVLILSEQSYASAWKMIPFFILTQLVAFIYFSHVQTLMYNLKKSKYTFICSASSVIVNIIVSIALVKCISIYAILLAQFVSQTVMAVMAVIMGNHAEKVDFGLKRMIMFIFEALVLMGVGMLVDYSYDTKISILILFIKILILCIGFMFFIFPYRKDFGQLIIGLVKKEKGGMEQ